MIEFLKYFVPTSIRSILRKRYGLAKNVACERGLSTEALLHLTRGYFESLEVKENCLYGHGWILIPSTPIERMELWIAGEAVCEVERMERPDVAQSFSFLEHAKNSGFRFAWELPNDLLHDFTELQIVGYRNKKIVGRLETFYRSDLMECVPCPPVDLIRRVDGCDIPTFYMLKGVKNYYEFCQLIEQYTKVGEVNSLLDWGCGCGRIISFFERFSLIPKIYGCDIDEEAIAWCQEHLPRASFCVSPLYPPTEYEAQQFDLIISFSVFTHLSRELQFQWLEELQRISRPGGYLFVTVQGEFAALPNLLQGKLNEELRDGIHDEIRDPRIGEVAPPGYYRSVFQTKEYTLREWSRYFEILECRMGGAGNHHDLIVMRNREFESL